MQLRTEAGEQLPPVNVLVNVNLLNEIICHDEPPRSTASVAMIRAGKVFYSVHRNVYVHVREHDHVNRCMSVNNPSSII